MVKRYQRHNQKPYIKEGQSIKWPKDTKGITRICISKDSQYNGQKIPRHNQKPYIKEGQSIQWPKDTKGITRSRISKKDSQYNGQ